MRALFVSASGALGGPGILDGGVQICSKEYLSVIEQAGFETSVYQFELDGRLLNRLDRKLRKRPYHNVLPPGLGKKVIAEVAATKASVVFLNLVDLAPLAKEIRAGFGSDVKIVLLSHGLGCADILHEIRLRSVDRDVVEASARDLRWLAGHLVMETDQRKYIDQVFCLSEFDVGLERWVGAQNVSWVPRIVHPHPLSWKPVPGRIGFVGTLDHAPNAEGLELFLREMEKARWPEAVVRVIGGPEKRGVELARRYPFVQYLGPLDNDQLEAEASSWLCAVHPLFCYSRGCSTKLAVLLGWEIPVLATSPGCRGYSWSDGEIPQAKDPADMVAIVKGLSSSANAESVQQGIVRVVNSSPKVSEIADLVRKQMRQIGCN